MLQKVKQQKQEGFTIIEVLIVLAIAGLIMLVVFMAVPALQRNSRNTQRKSDVSSLVGAMSEYVNNSNGSIPATCAAGATGCAAQQWLQNAKLSQYDANRISFTNRTSATAITAVTNAETINIYNYARCDGTTITTSNATARSVAASYAVESSGAPVTQCTEM